MKSFKRITSIVCFLAFFVGMNAQQTKILTADKHNEYGLVYTLPVTAFEIEVTVEKELRTAGPFYKYAAKYIGNPDVVKEDAEIWTLKDVKVKSYGIPDTEQQYLMQLKAGALTYLAVGDDGMLLAINTKPEPPVAPIADKKEVAGIILEPNEYLQYVNEDFTGAISSAVKARVLAEELSEIRDAKLALTRGTAETMPTDGKQLELMLTSLQRQEAALTAAFTGNVVKETIVRRFNFVPETNERRVIFRMSDFAGPVAADDYSGEPVYIDIKVTSEGLLPEDNKGEEKKFPKDGVAYCIPGTAIVSISFRNNDIFSKEFEMSQLGVVFGLNPSLFTDKKDPSYAIFDPATGALKELGNIRE